MDILYSHDTALTLLREHAGDTSFTRSRRALMPPGTTPAIPHREALGEDNGLVHVLVSKPEVRRPLPGVRMHLLRGELPSGGILSPQAVIGGQGNPYLCSPEIVFVQMAEGGRSTVELIQLGFELCGLYSVRPSDDSLVQHFPLTTPARLRATIDRCGPMRGVKAARRALPFILPNSASPMETILTMLLTLPPRLGGYALPTPELNPQLGVPKRTQDITSHRNIFPDVYYRSAREVLEYESDEFHLDPGRYARDSHRRAVLAHMGIHVTTVSRTELFDTDLFHATACSLARSLGHRVRLPEDTWRGCRRALRKTLLGPYQNRLRKGQGKLGETEIDREVIELSYGYDEWGDILTVEEALARGVEVSGRTTSSAEQDEASFWESLPI